MRDSNLAAVKGLNAMNQCWPINFEHQIRSDRNGQIRPDADEVAVERGVMQPTKSKSIRDMGFPERIGIRNDVCRIEQFLVPKLAEGTRTPISL